MPASVCRVCCVRRSRLASQGRGLPRAMRQSRGLGALASCLVIFKLYIHCIIKSRWRHNWKSAQVVNSHLVCDPTIRQPGFDLPRQQWSLQNRFCTEQGHCGACRKKMATYRHWSVSLWRDPDDIPHCRILSLDKTEWRLISATLCK